MSHAQIHDPMVHLMNWFNSLRQSHHESTINQLIITYSMVNSLPMRRPWRFQMDMFG